MLMTCSKPEMILFLLTVVNSSVYFLRESRHQSVSSVRPYAKRLRLSCTTQFNTCWNHK